MVLWMVVSSILADLSAVFSGCLLACAGLGESNERRDRVTVANQCEPLLHSVRDAQRMTSLSRATLYRMIAEKKLRPVHVGRAVRFTGAELRRFVERLEVEARLEADRRLDRIA
jgi:excisionase family DNA binding protein